MADDAVKGDAREQRQTEIGRSSGAIAGEWIGISSRPMLHAPSRLLTRCRIKPWKAWKLHMQIVFSAKNASFLGEAGPGMTREIDWWPFR